MGHSVRSLFKPVYIIIATEETTAGWVYLLCSCSGASVIVVIFSIVIIDDKDHRNCSLIAIIITPWPSSCCTRSAKASVAVIVRLRAGVAVQKKCI